MGIFILFLKSSDNAITLAYMWHKIRRSKICERDLSIGDNNCYNLISDAGCLQISGYPSVVMGDSGVESVLSRLSAPLAPADKSHNVPAILVFHDVGRPTISLTRVSLQTTKYTSLRKCAYSYTHGGAARN